MATVLVVDDEYALAEAVEELLQFEGFTTVVAHDGLQALEILRRQPIDVVVLDVMMPGLDGFGVLEAKSAEAAIKGIPVILASATQEEVVRERLAQPDGITDFLRKPFTATRLSAAVRRALQARDSGPPP